MPRHFTSRARLSARAGLSISRQAWSPPGGTNRPSSWPATTLTASRTTPARPSTCSFGGGRWGSALCPRDRTGLSLRTSSGRRTRMAAWCGRAPIRARPHQAAIRVRRPEEVRKDSPVRSRGQSALRQRPPPKLQVERLARVVREAVQVIPGQLDGRLVPPGGLHACRLIDRPARALSRALDVKCLGINLAVAVEEAFGFARVRIQALQHTQPTKVLMLDDDVSRGLTEWRGD